jgi:hypothetical protein
MTKRQAETSATPMAVRDVLLLLLQADAYPILGNEDVPVALRMERAALRRHGIGPEEREEVLGAM